MRDPAQWEEADLLELIALHVEESLTLDYKASDALDISDEKRKAESKRNLSKDVSALANSAGGTLVYGVVEDKHVPTGVDKGVDPKAVTKEWIEQVINSSIQRRLDGVKIRPVPLTGGSPGRVAYVVVVPQSFRAPHQASDKRFYKRFNFESVPMEEYEVRDTARRQLEPDLRVWVALNVYGPATNNVPQWLRVRLILRNEADEPSDHAAIELSVDKRLKLRDRANLGSLGDAWIGEDRRIPAERFLHQFGGGEAFPIIRGVEQPLNASIDIVVSAQPKGPYLLRWTTMAGRMRPRSGLIVLEIGEGRDQRADEITADGMQALFADERIPWEVASAPNAPEAA